ncbi:MAG: hypothetical protein JW776_07765 [Candidatus Lokiarchaeota archaeon]|nr:hypothetical protein [Candidatus Lokiarchaeota archaeon]
MVASDTLDYYYVKTYETYLKFFQEDLGIVRPIRTLVPHSDILNELKYAQENGFNEIGKGIIAKHVLLSFIPKPLRDNGLILLYNYKKLLKGNSPLSIRTKSSLSRYFELTRPIIEKKIKAHSDLANAMLNAIPLLLPDENVDFYYNNYIKRLNQTSNFIVHDDYVFLDNLIDDFWITNNWKYTLEELSLLIVMSQFFDKNKLPYSIQEFETYLQKIPSISIPGLKNNPWQTNFTHLKQLWKKFANQGVSFIYAAHIDTLGLNYVFYLIQVPPKINCHLLKYVLQSIGASLYLFENLSQSCPVFYGVMIVPHRDISYMNRFFNTLKEMGTILDYFLIVGKKYAEQIVNNHFNPSLSTFEYKKVLWETSSETFHKIDALDSIFLYLLRLGGFMGFPLESINHSYVKIIKNQVRKLISDLDNFQKNLSEYQENLSKCSRTIVQILPKCLITDRIMTLKDCVDNVYLSLMEETFFFKKWQTILTHLQNYQKSESINEFNSIRKKNSKLFVKLTNEINNLQYFMDSCVKNKYIPDQQLKYPVISLIDQILNQTGSSEKIAEIVKNINTILFYIDVKYNPQKYEAKVIDQNKKFLLQFHQLPDAAILKEFETRLNIYIAKNMVVPDLSNSVNLSMNDYFDYYFFPSHHRSTYRSSLFKIFQGELRKIYNNIPKGWNLEYGRVIPQLKKYQWETACKSKLPLISFIEAP